MSYTTEQIDTAIALECRAWAAFFEVEPTPENLAQRAAFHRANLTLGHIGQLAEFLPRTAMHYTDKTHFFSADDSTHCSTVITTMVAPQRFEAFTIEGENVELDIRGHGFSRLDALADLNEKLQALRECEALDDDA